jgi:hypothetical protein
VRGHTFMRLSEKAFQQQVIDLAHLYGWMAYHTYDSRRSVPGYPDLALVHKARGEYLLAELKSERGRLSLAQRQWIDALRQANIEIYIWRPSDFSHIVARLTTGRCQH